MRRQGIIVDPVVAGVERLWESRVLHVRAGMDISPTMFFAAADVNWSALTIADRVSSTVLSLAGAGANPSSGYSPAHPGKSVAFPGAKYFSGNGIGDIGANDLWFGAIASPTVATRRLASQMHLAPSNQGWQLYVGASYGVSLYVYSGGSFGSVSTPALSGGAWGLFTFGINKTEATGYGGRGFANGVVGTGVDLSALGTFSNSGDSLMLGSGYDGTLPFIGGVAALFAYSVADLWSAGATGAAEMQALALKQLQIYTGLAALRNDSGSIYPSSM